MRPQGGCLGLPGLGMVIALMAGAGVAQGADANAAARTMFDRLLRAIEASDRASFVAEATDPFRQAMTQGALTAMNRQLGPRLRKGHQASYLCDLRQQGLKVHLWKVTFQDGGDDVVVRIVLKDGKLAGFFLQ